MGKGEQNEAGIREDDKADTGGLDKAGLGQENKVGIEEQNKVGRGERDDKGVVEPAARVCCTEVHRLLRRNFLLAVRSNSFLAFSSLESVIGELSSSGSIANSGLLVTSTNCGATSLR